MEAADGDAQRGGLWAADLLGTCAVCPALLGRPRHHFSGLCLAASPAGAAGCTDGRLGSWPCIQGKGQLEEIQPRSAALLVSSLHIVWPVHFTPIHLHHARPQCMLQVAQYAVRFAADWACLELLTHCLYCNSIAKHRIGLRYRQYGLQYGPVEMGEAPAHFGTINHWLYISGAHHVCMCMVGSFPCLAAAQQHAAWLTLPLPACSIYCILGPLLYVAQVCHHLAVLQVSSPAFGARCLTFSPAGLHWLAHSCCDRHHYPLLCMHVRMCGQMEDRLAALLDGIDPPENMRRCFANNYDIEVRAQCACAISGVKGNCSGPPRRAQLLSRRHCSSPLLPHRLSHKSHTQLCGCCSAGLLARMALQLQPVAGTLHICAAGRQPQACICHLAHIFFRCGVA